MQLGVLVLRIALALVFAVAAVGKLADLAGSRRAVEEFGLPARGARVVGVLLPVVELAIAVALVPTASGRWAALVGLALLLGFVGAIGRLMRAGQAPECHCFGQLHSEPAGRSTLVRNGVLAAVAAIVLIAGPGRGLDTLTGEDAALLVVSVVMLTLAAVSAALVGENRRLRKRPAAARRRPPADPGLPIGTSAPDLTLRSTDGRSLALSELIAQDNPAILVNISPSCGPCRTLAPNLTGWQESVAGELTLVTLSSGDDEENAAFAREMGLEHLLIAERTAFGDAYRARATPSAVLLDAEGRVAARAVAGPMAVEALIRVALGRAGVDVKADPLGVVHVAGRLRPRLGIG